MKRLEMAVAGMLIATFSVSVADAQSVVSARSGLVHYLEGKALLDGQAVRFETGKFPELRDGSTFRTEEGRAEILLTPGVFLRLGENSQVKMISSRLTSTRLELLQGSALVECAEMVKGTSVTFALAGKDIPFQKKGLFRLDAAPPLLRVYSGEAAVISQGVTTTVKDGREVPLDSALLVATKFNKDDGDALYRWAKRRAGYLAVANISAARKAERGFMQSPGYIGGWMWNPYFGMITYVPFRGSYFSPFGYHFWSPQTVYAVYERPRYTFNEGGGMPSAASSSPIYNAELGYSTATRSAGNYPVGAPSAAISPSAAPAAAAPSAPTRSSDAGGGRGAAGGRR